MSRLKHDVMRSQLELPRWSPIVTISTREQAKTRALMATADQVKALIRCHAEGDDTRFYAIAMQVAAQAARSGHGKFAQELRELLDQVRLRAKTVEPARSPKAVPLAQPRGELAGLLSVTYPKTRLADMALTDALRGRLDRLVTEQRARDRIRAHGFTPMRKLLLVGPPGTGKTMTAATLAGELGLPLFSIQLDGLITKYMGETAAKLRLVFDAIQSTRGSIYSMSSMRLAESAAARTTLERFAAYSTPSSNS
jgi:hypothetical protein